MPFLTYEQTKPYAQAIAQATRDHKMPPWFADSSIGHFSNDPSLNETEISTLIKWANASAPAGNPSDAPPQKQWTTGWQIPTPDKIITMPTAVKLPATGDIDYTYEIVPTHFTQDTWIQSSEIRPSARANVHHAVVYIRPPNSNWLKHAPLNTPFTGADMTDSQARRDTHFTTADILLVYAPGSSPDAWPAGAAKLIPANSDLVFQMHYISHAHGSTNTPHPHATTDQTSIALIFSKSPPTQCILTLQLTNDRFVIPPGVPDYHVEVHGSIPNDATLLSFFPHMHLRGKTFEYNLLRPHQPPQPLLRVNYDFYWQLSYRLATPLQLKAGDTLQATATFDNSKNNPHNPDPTVAVRWGDQTQDEMMVGFFDIAVPAATDKPHFFLRSNAPPEH
jgi:copper type II ascorbate-dependent monooxygenase-like protein